ncbi:Sodium/calcium exchanger protein-domain-containing protein [Pseudoneurospora amorphoporcata]|uniref:Sodium/calcium exchanger protein-domain-containing protein n=1 Tax=Pseudoneurospora amorphoporcata TaxID=241081 RepID=A0AAN6SD09_9PEZI|nr:Sodium/calcium exchanger protein-domain-containing protein [Pseudoneurospora amorphoporcata]
MVFNNLKVRQEAYRVSRDSNSIMNPWRNKRSSTWDVPESQRYSQPPMGHEGLDDTAPIKHSVTAPSRVSNGYDSANGEPSYTQKKIEMQDMEPTSQMTGLTGETDVESVQVPTGSAHQRNGSLGLVRRRTTNANDSRTELNGVEQKVTEKEKEKKQRTFFKHLTPKEPFTVGNQIRRTLLGSWINILLVAAPVGIAINYVEAVPRVAVFVVNFIAIIPLAAMLGFATEEIALRTGEVVGGLLNASFGNAVELIVAVIALTHDEIVVVQTSLIGSILSNLLLVMGMCFFCGGLNRREQFFNTTVAQTAASLLALAVGSVIVPTVFDMAIEDMPSGINYDRVAKVAQLSRGVSIILLFVYGGYLLFQLKTHSSVFAEESQKVAGKPFNFRGGKDLKDGAIAQGLVSPAGMVGGHAVPSRNNNESIRNHLDAAPHQEDEEEEGEEPQLHFIVAVATLVISTVIIAFCAEYMVDGISAITNGNKVSKEFVGLILLPIVGNAAEHATAVTVAIKDKMDLAIGVAVGSSMQVALFVIPLLVIIGWGMGIEEMSLSFDTFQVAVLFVSVLLVNYLIADGKSHWLEGMLLICLYLIVAVCAWFYPNPCEGPDCPKA